MAERCSTPSCRALVHLEDGDIIYETSYNMCDGVYVIIGWNCHHCNQFVVLFTPHNAFLHTTEEITASISRGFAGTTIPITEAALALVLEKWTADPRYIEGDTTLWSREHPHPLLKLKEA
jgi:hypothetical protein